MENKKRLLLVDGHGLAFRGFYALPEMNAPDGTPTNAVLGFINMLTKAMEEWKPDGVGLFFDPKGPTARNAMYDAYKEGRRPTPDEFKVQMPLILELAESFGYPIFTQDGVEADDLIASTAIAGEREGVEAIILSADKDLMQVLSGDTKMARPSKGISEFKMYDEKKFLDEYGFPPSAMADYLALVGDSVDNIPGVAGIGDKTARSLLQKYGSLGGIYDNLDDLPKGQRAKLESGKEAAYKSYELIVPQPVQPVAVAELTIKEFDRAEAAKVCKRLGFKKLVERLGLDEAEGESSLESGEASPVREAHPVSAGKILAGESLAMVLVDKGKILAMSESGECCELDDTSVEKWFEADEKAIILADYRSWCVRKPFIARFPDKVFDVEMAHYFYHPDARSHELGKIAGEQAGPVEEVLAMLSLRDEFLKSDRSDAMLRVMREIDAPLTPVLIALHDAGLYADADELKKLGNDLESNVSQIEREIFEAAGGVINLNSPKQVGELLFDRLRLPVIKKTKTGYSTDAGVLEELSRLPAPLNAIPSKMIEFRECSKMLSGFVQPFLKYARESPDGRIRSTFLHNVTGTARLASRDPNVQNLPVFGDWAVRFRRSIRPNDGDKLFVAADYSQIELRVLAHLSGEPRLVESFKSGRDIHLETASWVFDMDPEDITPEQRRFAKTVNFGLLYGMGAHGLAVRMGIPRHQAAGLVERYFSVLPGVREYIERSAREAKERGCTTSVFGRIRPLAEVSTIEGRGGNPIDRVAVNTPIQSTAADIAKIALVRFEKVLRETHRDVKLVLQVHDSLICETPRGKADEVERLLVGTMESVDVISVPLRADAKKGETLADI